MGASLDIFRLYRIPDGTSVGSHLLVKAVRPEFPNWSQTADDEALEEVERRFDAILAREVGQSAGAKAESIATWESALPEGDCFCESASGVDLSIWFALDTAHPGYFVFGAEGDELTFWANIKELSRSGEICDVSHYCRPAMCVQVRFVQ